MRELRVEMKNMFGEWVMLGLPLEDNGPSGTLTNEIDAEFQVFRFRMKNGRSTIERSIPAYRNASLQVQASLPMGGWEKLAELGDDETFEVEIQTARMTAPAPLRWHQVADA